MPAKLLNPTLYERGARTNAASFRAAHMLTSQTQAGSLERFS